MILGVPVIEIPCLVKMSCQVCFLGFMLLALVPLTTSGNFQKGFPCSSTIFQLLVSFLNSISCCAAFLFVETPRHVRHLFSNYKKSATCRMLLFPIEKRNIPLSFSPFLPFHSISSQMDCPNYTNITTIQAPPRTAYPQPHSPRPRHAPPSASAS